MWVPADSHPHGVPKHLVEAGGCAKQGTVASHLNIANSPCPKRCPYSRVNREGLVSVKLWQIPSFVNVSKGFTTLHHVSVGTRPACLSCLSQTGWPLSEMLVGREKLDSEASLVFAPNIRVSEDFSGRSLLHRFLLSPCLARYQQVYQRLCAQSPYGH